MKNMTVDDIIKKLNSYNPNLVSVNVHFRNKKLWFEKNEYDYESTRKTRYTTTIDGFEIEPLLVVETNIVLHIFLNTDVNTIPDYLYNIDQLLLLYESKNSDIFKIKQSLDSSDTKEKRLLKIVKCINFPNSIED